jgi:hypothetical protein
MSSAQISGISGASFTSISISSSPQRTFTVLCFDMPPSASRWPAPRDTPPPVPHFPRANSASVTRDSRSRTNPTAPSHTACNCLSRAFPSPSPTG